MPTPKHRRFCNLHATRKAMFPPFPTGFQLRRYGPFPEAITAPLTHISTYNCRHVYPNIPYGAFSRTIIAARLNRESNGWPTSKIRATPCRFASSAFPSKIRSPSSLRAPPRTTLSQDLSSSYSNTVYYIPCADAKSLRRFCFLSRITRPEP